MLVLVAVHCGNEEDERFVVVNVEQRDVEHLVLEVEMQEALGFLVVLEVAELGVDDGVMVVAVQQFLRRFFHLGKGRGDRAQGDQDDGKHEAFKHDDLLVVDEVHKVRE